LLAEMGFVSVCLAARGRYAQQLFRDLFMNYTSALRPVNNTENAISVTLQVTLSQIIDMDERNQILTLYLWVRQVWMDSFLTWSKDDYDGLDSISIPSRYVWKPDIVLYNSADDEFSSSMETNVALRSDGKVTWDQPSITKSSCSVDVAFFPFDLQQCVLTFGSWTHNGNQMDLNIELDTADLADLVPNVEWQVLGMPAKKNVILYGCCSDPYPDITFTLQLKRRASFYIFNLLLPCMMISFLAPLGFYLPAESGEKVSLGVTVLLALTVFQLLVAESMPPSESVPLIGKYYIATMTMVTASTALTIFIMNLHHCGPEARPVPHWVRVLVLKYLNRVCLVYELGETCSRETEESQAAEGAHGWDDLNGYKHDQVSVTINKTENSNPICARQVQSLTQTNYTNLRPQEIRNNTICDRNSTKTGFKDTNDTETERTERGGTQNGGQALVKMAATKIQRQEEEAKDEGITERSGREKQGEELQDDGDVFEKVKVFDNVSRESGDGNDTANVETESDESAAKAKVSRKSSSESGAGGVCDSRDGMQMENLRKNMEFVGKNDKFTDVTELSGSAGCVCCHCCCRRVGPGIRGDGCGCRLRGDAAWGRLRGDVTSIAASFQEQRDAQTLIGDWRKVGKVLDRALMWIFFIMVFIMSVLILGKSI
ncbi:neuronal acetylcholine receptor subunit alpha-10-like, partial [Boleophthalmus pectinirostris]|uniref:neuronal acetylcholine receptor subunit alpha-10-like n=1 Tax=Boleophthalmus pectinirostris TaxID=150288 RepID=UPI00242C2E34